LSCQTNNFAPLSSFVLHSGKSLNSDLEQLYNSRNEIVIATFGKINRLSLYTFNEW